MKDSILTPIGDERGPAFVIDVCKPGRSNNSNHAFVAMPSLESLAPEEIEYLRFKGCFSLPPHPLREALIKAYFHYVQPFEPVLDPEDFFNKYSKGHLSLLLLWNIFMCAASVCLTAQIAGARADGYSLLMIVCLSKTIMILSSLSSIKLFNERRYFETRFSHHLNTNRSC